VCEAPRTSISQIAVNYKPQVLRNIWSGEEMTLGGVYKYVASSGLFTDYTSNVLKSDFNVMNSTVVTETDGGQVDTLSAMVTPTLIQQIMLQLQVCTVQLNMTHICQVQTEEGTRLF